VVNVGNATVGHKAEDRELCEHVRYIVRKGAHKIINRDASPSLGKMPLVRSRDTALTCGWSFNSIRLIPIYLTWLGIFGIVKFTNRKSAENMALKHR